MTKSLHQLLVEKGVAPREAQSVATALEAFIAEKQEDMSSSRCSPESAYEAIASRLAEFGLTMHDFVEYPDAQSWENGFSLISEAIKAETQTRNMPLDTFWLVSDIYGEKAHGLHVDTYAHLSVAFLTKLHAIVEQLLVGWRVVVFSDTAGEDFRVVISDEGVKVEKTVVAHNEPNGGY